MGKEGMQERGAVERTGVPCRVNYPLCWELASLPAGQWVAVIGYLKSEDDRNGKPRLSRVIVTRAYPIGAVMDAGVTATVNALETGGVEPRLPPGMIGDYFGSER